MSKSQWTTAQIPPQSGKLAVVTGANSGIGWNTALELARAGAEVILTARTEEKGADAIQRIHQQLPSATVRYELLDLANLQSVRAFATRISSAPKLDLLINNAGIMAIPTRKQTADGFEMQFGTNYLGHFALTLLLLPTLRRSTMPRVTTVSSIAANMLGKKIYFEDLNWEKSYSAWRAYCQSKLADLYLMMELARRSEAAGLNLINNAAHPGYSRTNLQFTGPERIQRSETERLFERIASQDAAGGAEPTLRAATALDTASRTYYAPDGLFALKGAPKQIPVPPAAQNAAVAKQLWTISEELTGVSWPANVS